MPVTFTDEDIESIRASLPELPEAMRNRFVQVYQISEYDAGVMTSSLDLAHYFDQAAQLARTPKLVANWISSELLRLLGEDKISVDECRIKPEHLAQLTDMIDTGKINGKIGKEVFAQMYETGKTAEVIVQEKGLVQVSDAGAIHEFVRQAIENNPKQVEDYRSGNPKVLQYFVGQVMKLSRGKANPQLVVGELQKALDEL